MCQKNTLRVATIAVAIAMTGATRVSAESSLASGSRAGEALEKAACSVFAGREDCRTVRVFDAEECIVKVHPRPLPDIEPSALACLRDEVHTRKVYLRKLRARDFSVSDRIHVAGENAVEELVGFDGRGAAVWQFRDADSFELKGDPLLATNMVGKISSQICVGPSRLVGGGTSGGTIGPREAFDRAAKGNLALIDIRHPSEWRRTGVGANAIAMTMHQNIYRFVDQLKRVANNNRQIALICAEGVRSSTMQKTLMEFGFKDVMDVSEGMEGGTRGAGWTARGLPVIPYGVRRAERTR